MRARMTLRYADIRCELREVVLRDKPPEMLVASPKGTVPVLLAFSADGEEQVIEESLDIMHWALAQDDPAGWLDVDRVAAEHLIAATDDDFKTWLDRYKYPDRSRDVEGNQVADVSEAWDECARFLSTLDELLNGQAFLMGDTLSYADAAIFPFVRQFAFVDKDRFDSAPYAHLQQWLAKFLEAELFTAVMDKYPAWKAGDDKVIF